MLTVTVVTPWVDHRELADGYWNALEAGQPDEVIIVDNGSWPPLGYCGIRFEQNRGFQEACNAGLLAARSDAVLFLNNDIELGRSDWLDEIRDALEPGRLVGRVVEPPWAIVDGRHHPYIDGWCLAGTKVDLLMLGGWDESLAEPAYYGDNMLALQAEQAGLELHHVDIGLRHLEGGTAQDNGFRVHRAAMANRARWLEAVRAHQLVTT